MKANLDQIRLLNLSLYVIIFKDWKHLRNKETNLFITGINIKN